MENNIARYTTGKFVLGSLLIALGVVMVLDNLDIIYIDHISHYWPAIFIAFGAAKLFESADTPERGKGIWWIFFGAWLLVSLNGIWGLTFQNSWPLLLIAAGVSSIWKGYYRQPQWTSSTENQHGN